MFADPSLLLTVSLVCLAFFHLIPRARAGWRHGWVLACSLWMIAMVAPYALLLALAMSGLAWGFARRLARSPDRRLLFLGVALLVAASQLQEEIAVTSDSAGFHGGFALDLMLTLGLAFVLLKSIEMLVDAHYERKALALREVLMVNLFFPLYAAGPIEDAAALAPARFAAPVGLADIGFALRRLVIGWFKLAFLSGAVLSPFLLGHWPAITTDPGAYPPGSLMVATLCGFFMIYVNFSGYCDIAVGLSRLFGIRVIENFDKPWLASNVANFWQRWHRSLGRWIVRNIHAPAVRAGWRAEAAIVVSFVLVGLWHHPSPLYALWGLANGLAFAWARWLERASRGAPVWWRRLRASVPYRVFAVALTISFLALVSRFAKMPDLATALAYLEALL